MKLPEFKTRHIDREKAMHCVGFGWHGLLDDIYDTFEKENVVVVTIKEKFGGLRIYADAPEATFEKMRPLIDKIEQLSFQTCETCGAPGVLRNRPWLKTLCDEHSDGSLPLFKEFKEFVAPQLELFEEYNEL